MTKQHLYPTKFWAAKIWDYLKGPFGLLILSAVLWVIWCYHTGQDPLAVFQG